MAGHIVEDKVWNGKLHLTVTLKFQGKGTEIIWGRDGTGPVLLSQCR